MLFDFLDIPIPLMIIGGILFVIVFAVFISIVKNFKGKVEELDFQLPKLDKDKEEESIEAMEQIELNNQDVLLNDYNEVDINTEEPKKKKKRSRKANSEKESSEKERNIEEKPLPDLNAIAEKSKVNFDTISDVIKTKEDEL